MVKADETAIKEALNCPIKSGRDNGGRWRSVFIARRFQVFSLVSNNRCRWPEDNFRRALMAGVLLKILRAAGYFGEERRRAEEEEEGGAEPTSEEVFVGTLLLRNLQVDQKCFAFLVYIEWTRVHLFRFYNLMLTRFMNPSEEARVPLSHGKVR